MWWQRMIPRYGNWGAPEWSAREWNANPALTDWSVNSIDRMDSAFKCHDYAYQRGRDVVRADRELLQALRGIEPRGVYARLYRRGVYMVFGVRVYLADKGIYVPNNLVPAALPVFHPRPCRRR